MKGWQIFIHSVRLVFNNLDAALRVSLVPYLATGVALVVMGLPAQRVFEGGDPAAMAAMDMSLWVNYMFYMIVYAIAALWIAVAWHRYVLLEEIPNGWLPRFHGSQMLGYFLKGLILGLVLLLVSFVSSLVLGLLIGWAGPAGAALVGLGTLAIGTVVFYRLCPILPSAALGQNMSISDAMEATKGATQTIFLLTLLVLVASFVIQLPATFGSANSAFGLAYSFVINWISMLVGVSVLTTFFGHYVEGRPID